MPVLLGPLIGFSLGAAIAALLRDTARTDGEAARRAKIQVALLFGALVYAPACATFMVLAPDWALLYAIDADRVPSALLLIVALIDGVAIGAGFALAHEASRLRAWRALLGLAIGPASLAAIVAIAMLPRLRIEGTARQMAAGFGTRSVAGGPLGAAVLWAWVTIAIGAVVAVRSMPGEAPTPARRGDRRG